MKTNKKRANKILSTTIILAIALGNFVKEKCLTKLTPERQQYVSGKNNINKSSELAIVGFVIAETQDELQAEFNNLTQELTGSGYLLNIGRGI